MYRHLMKPFLSLLLFAALTIPSNAQGINFEQGNWASVKRKAKHAHKMIYLDVFTSWCGPCKMMAKNYFPKEVAGTFYNSNFICYQVDAEKGEGVEIAKQYDVNGYPTNLFIDPSNEKVIYRTMGMPQKIEEFVENGKIALLEKQDPMSISDYEKKLESGNYDESFLIKYLEKNNRLAIDNDKLIDVYLEKYAKNEDKDSVILLVSKYQSGVENNGYKFLATNQFRLNKLKNTNDYFNTISQEYYFQSLEKAVKEKNEDHLNALLKNMMAFDLTDPQNVRYQYRSKFYKATKNQKKLEQVEDEYADYLMVMSPEKRANIAHQELFAIKKQIKWQAEQMGTPESKIGDVIARNLQNPQIKYMKEILYAQELNEISWSVYEQNKKDIINNARVKKAIVWTKRAMSLIEPVETNWLPIADTYAHLLAINGDKDEAVSLEEEVVTKATKSEDPGIDDYKSYLKELRK